jgi:hypothetical protein
MFTPDLEPYASLDPIKEEFFPNLLGLFHGTRNASWNALLTVL